MLFDVTARSSTASDVYEFVAPKSQFPQPFQPHHPCPALPRKNISLPFFRNSCFSPSHPASPGGAARDRHGRWRQGAVAAGLRSARCARRRTQALRTAKACGLGPPMLGSSLATGGVGLNGRGRPAGRRRQSKPGLRRERAISRKPIAQGMPGCSGLACGTCRLHSLLQAGHGCGLHPAFPAPSQS
jgi:hypothetical protein